MPNHWHLVLRPRQDGDLSRFTQWLTVTHVRRWHAHRQSGGTGHLYHGRFKSFPVQTDAHFLTVCRYVERNALRANLVRQAQDWRWCSLWRRLHRDRRPTMALSAWPVDRPRNWRVLVNEAQTAAEVETVRRRIVGSRPYGRQAWLVRTARQLGLESALRPRGRPRRRSPIKST